VAKATFRAELRSSGSGRGGHLVEVPQDVIATLGGRGRTPVSATFDGVSYRGSIVKMRGITMIGVTKAIMAEAGVGVGDTLTVVLENDDAPREVDVPEELTKAFRRSQGAKAEWDRLPFTHQREYVEAILDAKRPETRARRIETTIEALRARSRSDR
jgi:Domain of unknown function (DUF1905)/Bacteriocin-protection, YdeI or OmpD-Associated